MTIETTRLRRLGLPLLAMAFLFLAAAPATTWAQEEEQERERKVTVEVRNGKVYVNGEESNEARDGRVVIRKGDGEEIVFVIEGDEGGNWFSLFSENEEGPEGLARRFRLRSPGSERAIFLENMPEPGDLEEAFELQARVGREMGEVRERLGREYGALRQYEQARDAFVPMQRLRWMSEDMRSMEGELRDLARQIRRAEDSERAELEQKLDEMLAKAFEEKMTREREQVAELEARLGEMRARLSEREAARRDIIQRRRKELMGERDHLDW